MNQGKCNSALLHAALLPEFVDGLRAQGLAVNELLRHFWRTLPINSKAKANKASRVVGTLEDLYKQSEAMQAAASAQDKTYIAQLLRPSMNAMDLAFQHYDAFGGEPGTSA
jgi:hypothetical protein